MRLAMGGSIPHVDLARGTRAGTAAKGGRDGARVENAETETRTAPSPYDWDRLERAVRTLVSQQEALRRELRVLRSDLGERNHRIRTLETQLIEANQRRQDTGKRIDELIAQLDQLDAQLATAEPNA
jgi:chromosome segregation ATPase